MTCPVMDLYLLEYDSLFTKDQESEEHIKTLTHALHTHGIVGIRGVPQYPEQLKALIRAAKTFSALDEHIKLRYALFDEDAEKDSYCAEIPENPNNRWPAEFDLRTPYLELSTLIMETGKKLLNF